VGSPFFLKTLQLIFQWGGKLFPGLTGYLAYQLFALPPKRKRKPYPIFSSAETSTLYHNKKRVTVYHWMPANLKNAPVVILAHGWGGSAQSWQAAIEPLLDSGFKVVTFDGPAHGTSSGRQSNLIEFATVMRLVSEKTGPVQAIVGHSFGGMVTAYAVNGKNNAPNLQTTQKLILISTPNKLTDILAQFGGVLNIRPKTLDNLAARIEKVAGQSVENFSTAILLGEIDVPVLVIHNNPDREVPYEDGQAIAKGVPNAQLVTTEGLGHHRIIRSPEVVGEVVRFLMGK